MGGVVKILPEKSLEGIAWQTWPPEFLKSFVFEHSQFVEEFLLRSYKSKVSSQTLTKSPLHKSLQSRICGGNEDKGHRAGQQQGLILAGASHALHRLGGFGEYLPVLL